MERELEKIEALIKRREIKKAEVIIAKLFRSQDTSLEQISLLKLRAHLRLIAGRVEDALNDLQSIENQNHGLLHLPEFASLRADCYLARFESASIGFADKLDVRRAQELYLKTIQQFPDYENLGWLYYQYGRALLIEDRASAAESSFHKALFASSTVKALTAYCYERLAFIAFYESRQAKQALTYLDKAIDTYPKTENPLWLVQVYLLKSRVLKECQLDEAILAAKRALQMAGDNRALVADTSFAVAELLELQAGTEQEIIAYLQIFMQNAKSPLGVDVTWSRAYEMLGDAYQETAQFDAALIAYENALAINPYHPWEESLQYRMARVYYQQGAFNHCIERLQEIINSDKGTDDYRIYSLLGNASFALGYFSEAAKHYEKALALAPHGTDIQAMQSYYYLALNPPL